MVVFSVLAKAWNFLVGVAPTLLHTACKIVEGASEVVKIGGGA